MTSRKTKQDLTVPVLDKGDHQNKKNLCDFLEQEEIAQRMLKEAHDFYESFLRSKSVPFSRIFEYPSVFFVRPVVSAYWRDIKVDKYGNIKPLTGKNNEVCIVVSFEYSYGCAPNGDLNTRIYNMLDSYRHYDKETHGNYYFKDGEIAENLYQQYFDFLYGGEYNETSDTMRCRKRFIMTVDEINKFVLEKKSKRKSNLQWLDWMNESDIEDDEYYEDNFCDEFFNSKAAPVVSYDYLSDKGKGIYSDMPYYVRNDLERRRNREPDIQKLRAIPQVEEFIQKRLPVLDKLCKERLKALLDNYKYDYNIICSPYLITKSCKPIELTTEEINESKVDKENGLYTVVTKGFTESHPEYPWPNDCDLIVTDYSQKFVFDIATNDLVGYEYIHYTHRESRKRHY